jgi:parvulin-like peptidyl-prolyl isomerase
MFRKLSLLAIVIATAGQREVALAQPAPAQATPAEAPAKPAADQPAPAADQPAVADAGPVAATVNGVPVYVAEVDQPFEAMQKAGRLGKEDPRLIKARILSQLIDRKVADQALMSDKTLYTEEEVEGQLKQLRNTAEKQGATLEQLVVAQGVSLDKLRQDVAFRIAMQRYVQKQLSTILPEYVRQHKAEFDGTEIRASHIMLRPGSFNETIAALTARASAIREEIASGSLDFAAAAQKYSAAPSRDRGGDVGFIPRRGVMLEPFSAALFALKTGEISQPVATTLGVHLILAGEVKPGTKDLKESLPMIQQLAADEVLKRMISDQRSRAKIEFTGAVPYFKPGTEELATP